MNGKLLINNLNYALAKECADLTDLKIKSLSKVNVKENKHFLYFNYKSIQNVFDFGRYYETLTPSPVDTSDEQDINDNLNEDEGVKDIPEKTNEKKPSSVKTTADKTK